MVRFLEGTLMEQNLNSRLDLHHIQRAIILSLVTRSPLRFTQLHPPRIPNNTFSYHLKKLVTAGYIESTPDGYIPTRKTLKMVTFNADQKGRVSTPAFITMAYVTNDDGETLLINRNLSPFQGWYGLPSGTVHLGETLDEAVRRELREKAGIVVDASDQDALKPIGVLDFQYRKEDTDELFAHAVAFLYSYRYSGDKTIINDKETRFGQLSWSKFGRSHILPEALAVKEIADIGEFVKKTVRFKEPSRPPVLALHRSP